jgi:Fe(3+) dicitrate transport protein
VPGVRLERVRSTVRGYTDATASFRPRTYTEPLAGLASEFILGESSHLYANVAQAYRPITYSSFTPVGSVARIDTGLRSSRGVNADLGWRGNFRNLVKFDVGTFYLWYGDRIGTRTGSDASGQFVEVANIGDSRHRGFESYVEFDPLRALGASPRAAGLDLFSSYAYVDARYVSGSLAGNRVEQAPRHLARFGATYSLRSIANTFQISHTSDSFGDANNSVAPTEDATGGLIPGYTLLDWSADVGLARWRLSFGVNNVTNAHYFTKRTAEYPGPGILPGTGRSAYLGVRAAF